MLDNKEEFKKENHDSWLANTEYWLNSPLRQVEDTKAFFKKKLKDILFDGCVVYDLGCGSGWLIDFILELGINFTYTGFDFNEKFIEYLQKRYGTNPNFEFLCADLEKPLPKQFYGKSDFAFNNFNFFEIPDLSPAFDNAVNVLNNKGNLIISTIDVTYLIMAVSETYDDFRRNLVMYENIKSAGQVPYFFQPIDLGNATSKELKYASVLYSFADYFKLAKSKQLILSDYEEIICEARFIPKVYQFMNFSK